MGMASGGGSRNIARIIKGMMPTTIKRQMPVRAERVSLGIFFVECLLFVFFIFKSFRANAVRLYDYLPYLVN